MTLMALAFFRLVSGLGDLGASTSSSDPEGTTTSSVGFDDDGAIPLPLFLLFSASTLAVFMDSAFDADILPNVALVRHAGLLALAAATSGSASPSASTDESDR